MEQLDHVKTAAVKIGTSSLLDDKGLLDVNVIEHLGKDIADLWKTGRRFLVITSGAVGLGKKHEEEDPRTSAMRGQHKLMTVYQESLEVHGLDAGQIMITPWQFLWRKSRQRFVDRVHESWKENTVVVVNANDPIATKHTTLGDNDSLSAKVARSVQVDALIFLSLNKETNLGRGGSKAKAKAIHSVEKKGITALVVDGKRPHVLSELFDGGHVLKTALRDSDTIRRHTKVVH